MIFGSLGRSLQNFEIIGVQILCSNMFTGFLRSYHEMPPCDVPSEVYYDIYVGRETEIPEFESLPSN